NRPSTEASMTEAEWLAAADPEPMLERVVGWSYEAGHNFFGWRTRPSRRVRNRKLRLFACACCRRVWHHVCEGGRRTVEAAERYADGGATVAELATARQAARPEFV